MSLSTPTQITVPFANTGLKNAIPPTSNNTTGNAGYNNGFPPVNMTPKVAGGIPPFGEDMNGILFDITKGLQYLEAGSSFVYDSTFATAIGGYKAGAVVLRTDGNGFWLNQMDGNTNDPEATGAAAAGWVPGFTGGSTSIAMTNANVTLDPLEYGKPIIIISGLLTANLNLIFPDIASQWIVFNNTTGAFSITAKTAAGSGVVVSGVVSIFGDATNIYSTSSASGPVYSDQQSISASVALNALTLGSAATTLDFRNPTITNGAPIPAVAVPALSLVVPSGATLGTVNGQSARLAWLVAYNGGTPVLCVNNMAGGVNLDESTLISPTTISGASNSASVIYSASSVTANSPFCLLGYGDISEATAGTWATAPTKLQGASWATMGAVGSFGFGQTYQLLTGSRTAGVTYYNTTGKPIDVYIYTGSTSNSTPTVGGVALQPFSAASGGTNCLTFTVPPGASYSVAGSWAQWYELR